MTTEARRYRDRISQDPQVMVGKPVVKGTRVPVELVLAKLAQNPSLDELFTDYPRLTLEDVKACLDYASALVEQQAMKMAAAPPIVTPAKAGVRGRGAATTQD